MTEAERMAALPRMSCPNCTLSMSIEQWEQDEVGHCDDGTYECPSCETTFGAEAANTVTIT
jgi:transposase-like protein